MTLCSAGLLIVSICDLSESLVTNYSDAPQIAYRRGPDFPAPFGPPSLSASLGVDVRPSCAIALRLSRRPEGRRVGRARTSWPYPRRSPCSLAEPDRAR